jgi:hypothetical protein
MMVFLKEMLVKRQLQVYFHGLLVETVMVVTEPPIFLCQYTLVTGRLEVTVHTKVTVLPVVTE